MTHLDELRRQLAAFGRPARGRRYPPALRMSLHHWLVTQRRAGRSWFQLSSELGLPVATLVRLAEPPASLLTVVAPRLVPVLAADSATSTPAPPASPSPGLRLVLPSGAAVSGLQLHELVQVLRGLL